MITPKIGENFDSLVSQYVEDRTQYRRYDGMDGPKNPVIYRNLYNNMTKAKQKLITYITEEHEKQIKDGIYPRNIVID